MFQPIVPATGLAGWNFLQSTYDTQLESYSSSTQIQNDVNYMIEKLSAPIDVDAFLDDQRLLRVTLTAFDLAGEEWKRGYIENILNEFNDPDSTFLSRLNNPKYTAFAEVFAPADGKVVVFEEVLADMATRFQRNSFEAAIGNVDNSMRVALNYQSEIADLVGVDSSEQTILYKLLGDEPVRKVMETALNLPSEFINLDIDQQASILKDRLSSSLGFNDLQDLKSEESITRVLQRYHAMEQIAAVRRDTSSAAIALTLLTSGVGSYASTNLFLGTIG